ncbi:MAG: cell division ATP-binding protein FtsE [Oscillospiraceae bacterium]|nr:cell division ATP-binding protein FtsE [Oscillospiraceae bacterium]
MIDFKHVTKVYEPKITALRDVSVHIDKGEFVFVLGHSGAGKSTFIKLMLREEKATKGEVVVNGYNLSKIKEKDIPYMRRTLGVVFQDFRLIPNLTAYENIAFAMRVTNIDEKEIKRRVPYILNLVGLAGKAGKLPAQLSGGEQQRVALARALVHNPDLVIADEPTGNIDPQLSIEIMELLKAINSTGTTVVVVTHEHDLARRYARRTIEMRGGVIVRDTAARGREGTV